MSAPRPSVFDTCLRGLSRKSPQEMHRTQETLRTVMHTIYSMLHTLAMNFLKSQVPGCFLASRYLLLREHCHVHSVASHLLKLGAQIIR